MELPSAPEAGSRAAYLASVLSELGLDRPERHATHLLEEFGSIAALAGASEERLRRCFAFAPGVLNSLLAARKIVSAGIRETALRTPLDPYCADLHRYLQHRVGHREEEILLGLFADEKGGFLVEAVLAIGDGHKVQISAKAVMRRAIALNAARLVLVHNHPSGQCVSSPTDVISTREIDTKAATLGIYLLDHLIVGGGRIYSIRKGAVL